MLPESAAGPPGRERRPHRQDGAPQISTSTSGPSNTVPAPDPTPALLRVRRVADDEPIDLSDVLLPAVCPPEHAARLAAVGLEPHCPPRRYAEALVVPINHVPGDIFTMPWPRTYEIVHCPLCVVGLDGQPAPDGCCLDAWDAVLEHESPPADPWCLHHGVPTPATVKSCTHCDTERRIARRDGWKGRPTGHRGRVCWHCDTCGLCPGVGAVCQECKRCLEHCEGKCLEMFERWSKLERQVVHYEGEVHDWISWAAS